MAQPIRSHGASQEQTVKANYPVPRMAPKKGPNPKDPKGTEEAVRRAAEKLGNSRDQLIPILQEVQKTFNYLPRGALLEAAELLDIPVMQVYSAASFFSAFSLEPRGERVISVCMGTACHVRQAPLILEALERELEISAGETTPDGKHTLLSVGCLGACALGPVVDVNGTTYGNMTVAKAERLPKKLEKQEVARARKRGGSND